jgi:putative thioredoxin
VLRAAAAAIRLDSEAEDAMNKWTFETGDRDFKEAVLERSRNTPVVVDFWAPWCGPCRALGPLLERLAEEHGGQFLLAKVNVDENPGLASAFRVQSIPFLAGFRDGAVVTEMVGALPEPEIRQFLQRILPSPAEQKAAAAEELFDRGELDAAEGAFREALQSDPRCDRAALGLARIHADRKEDDEALKLLEPITADPWRQAADRLAAEVRVRRSNGADDIQELTSRIDAHPDDLGARLHLGQALAAAGRYEEGLQQHLEVVRRDKEFQDGAARKAMLDIFELLGRDDEIVDRYRSELARVLFS